MLGGQRLGLTGELRRLLPGRRRRAALPTTLTSKIRPNDRISPENGDFRPDGLSQVAGHRQSALPFQKAPSPTTPKTAQDAPEAVLSRRGKEQ